MQYNEDKKEKLNRLERALYSRNAPDILDKGRTEFENKETEAKENWQGIKNGNFDELAARFSKVAEQKHSFVKKIFIASALFFVLAALAAGFVFMGGMNMVSSKNVDIEVFGPLSVPGGQEVSFDISIINNNNVDLEAVSLLVEYPEGTRSSADLSKELPRERFALENIKSGSSYRQNIKVVFFGEKESVKDMKISLEYRVENSSALFYKEKSHEVSISSSPVIITPTYPKEVNSNQEITFNVEVASNSKDKLNNFLVNVEYPFGFVFKDSSPKASFGEGTWSFSNINYGEKKNISIRGTIVGQNNEERVFRINAGTADENDERLIAVPIAQTVESILVKKPFIDVGVLIDGDEGDYIGEGGQIVNTSLVIKNNLPSKLFNTSVTVALRGGALNRLSVLPSTGGFFQSSNDTILWDRRSLIELSELGPGGEARLSFRLAPLLYSEIKSGTKPEIEITVTVAGERILDSGSVEKVSATEKRKIILGTDLNLISRTVRSLGNIENSGPIPPKADNPTTYSVLWSIENSFNQVSNVEVRAALPSYVKWTKVYSPSSEILTYNEITNELVWNVGSVLPNTGFGSGKKEIYFQLELLPSLSQLGQAPTLLGKSYLTATDKITGQKVRAEAYPVTTNFSGDPSYNSGDDKVVQ